MKKVLLSVVVVASLAIGITSCGKAKEVTKEAVEVTKEAAVKTTEAVKETVETVKEGAEKVADAVNGADEGKKLFTAKGCVACHKEQEKLVGPALKTIAKMYAEKKGNIVKFLKGNGTAIVDTDPAQVAVMQTNFAVTKAMKAEELQAIASYIRSVK